MCRNEPALNKTLGGSPRVKRTVVVQIFPLNQIHAGEHWKFHLFYSYFLRVLISYPFYSFLTELELIELVCYTDKDHGAINGKNRLT